MTNNDLVPVEHVERAIRVLRGHRVLLDSDLAALYGVNRARIERNREKGVNYSVKAMVIGMPNTGKSTLINSLCGFAGSSFQWRTGNNGFRGDCHCDFS